MLDSPSTISALKNDLMDDHHVLCYRGRIDNTITLLLDALSEYDVARKVRNRVTYLMIESFQNIIRHVPGDLQEQQPSLWAIRGVGRFVHIFSSNLASAAEQEELQSRLAELNGLSAEELEQRYLSVLAHGSISARGGGGLGLIDMARKSKWPLQTHFSAVDTDTYEYNLQVDLAVGPDVAEQPMSIVENLAVKQLLESSQSVFFYGGDFSETALLPIVALLKANTSGSSDPAEYSLVHTAVELIQNVSSHGLRIAGKLHGMFSVSYTEKGLFLRTGNYFDPSKRNPEAYIARINSLSKEELDTEYRTLLKASVQGPGNNAGVGLIDLRRSVMEPLEVEVATDSRGSYAIIGIEMPV